MTVVAAEGPVGTPRGTEQDTGPRPTTLQATHASVCAAVRVRVLADPAGNALLTHDIQ